MFLRKLTVMVAPLLLCALLCLLMPVLNGLGFWSNVLKGVLLGGGKELPFAEVEVELKDGTPEMTSAFAHSARVFVCIVYLLGLPSAFEWTQTVYNATADESNKTGRGLPWKYTLNRRMAYGLYQVSEM